jgi:carboxylesterase
MKKKYLTVSLLFGLSLFFPNQLRANNMFESNYPENGKKFLEKDRVVKGCEPFNYKGNNGKVVLLLHGLGGCPYEIAPVGEYLNKQGYSVVAIRYPGHGSKGNVMNNYGWEDWYKAAETEYLNLLNSGNEVYIAGFSTGGTIGLRLAEKYPVKKLALMSPFIYLTYKWYYIFTPEMYLNSIGTLITDLPSNMTLTNLNEPVARSNYIRGENFSLKATRSALKLIDLVKKDLPLVKTPTLLIHSKGDNTTDYRSSELILKNISSDSKRLITLTKSNHIITLDYEKDIVYQEVGNFFDGESKKN